MGEQFYSNFAKNSKFKNIFHVSNKERQKENSLQSTKKSHG